MGSRGGAQGDKHHSCGDTDPRWKDGACGGAAIVAVVGRYHGKVDGVVGGGEGVEGAGGELWDFDAVADGSAVATAVDGERVLGQRHVGGRCDRMEGRMSRADTVGCWYGVFLDFWTRCEGYCLTSNRTIRKIGPV